MWQRKRESEQGWRGFWTKNAFYGPKANFWAKKIASWAVHEGMRRHGLGQSPHARRQLKFVPAGSS